MHAFRTYPAYTLASIIPLFALFVPYFLIFCDWKETLSYVAETERNFIHTRQAEGIAAAKQKGVRFGRARIEIPEDFESWICLWKDGAVSRREIEERCQISTSTFYRRVRDCTRRCQQ